MPGVPDRRAHRPANGGQIPPQTEPPEATGIYLFVKSMPSDGVFDFVLMTNDGRPLERIDGTTEVQRRFPIGTPVAFVAQAHHTGRVWVALSVFKADAPTPQPSASSVGEHVAGQVVSDKAQVTAFK